MVEPKRTCLPPEALRLCRPWYVRCELLSGTLGCKLQLGSRGDACDVGPRAGSPLGVGIPPPSCPPTWAGSACAFSPPGSLAWWHQVRGGSGQPVQPCRSRRSLRASLQNPAALGPERRGRKKFFPLCRCQA